MSGQFSDLETSFENDGPEIKTVKHLRDNNDYGIRDSLKQSKIVKQNSEFPDIGMKKSL